MRVVVIGGGVGGLAAAIRLRAAGHDVALVERNETLGGKLTAWDVDGYTFDVGPSLLTLPNVFEELFAVAGSSLGEHLDLVRLDPQFRYHWSDGSSVDVHDDPATTVEAWEGLVRGAGAAWDAFTRHGGRIWDVAERTFFAGPMSNPLALARRMRSPRDLVTIDAGRTLRAAARAHLDEDRFVQWAGRYATYSGSFPHLAPATLACIPAIERRHGCWYPRGGLGTLRDALVHLAIDLDVDVRTSCDVHRVLDDGRRVTGVVTDTGTVDADVVVADVDAEQLYGELLPDDRALRRARRADRSTSGFVVCLGVRGATPGITHHQVWFADDDVAEFEALAAGRVVDEPTIYACVSSVTDPSQAPPGRENWFLLVNTPPGAVIDADAHADRVLARLAAVGPDLRHRVEVRRTLTPAEIERRDRTSGGSIYGTSSNGRRAAFVRPGNRGARHGLYLVGGSSHPGGGLPLVATSARIVADLVADDHGARAGRRRRR